MYTTISTLDNTDMVYIIILSNVYNNQYTRQYRYGIYYNTVKCIQQSVH